MPCLCCLTAAGVLGVPRQGAHLLEWSPQAQLGPYQHARAASGGNKVVSKPLKAALQQAGARRATGAGTESDLPRSSWRAASKQLGFENKHSRAACSCGTWLTQSEQFPGEMQIMPSCLAQNRFWDLESNAVSINMKSLSYDSASGRSVLLAESASRSAARRADPSRSGQQAWESVPLCRWLLPSPLSFQDVDPPAVVTWLIQCTPVGAGRAQMMVVE